MKEEIKEIKKDASMQEYTMNISTDNADYSVVYVVKNDLLVQVIAKVKIAGTDLGELSYENGYVNAMNFSINDLTQQLYLNDFTKIVFSIRDKNNLTIMRQIAKNV
jgi:hypothetical protein|nr:MAG: hypothetical protein [Bacteriophage sp.]DAV56200.1 MAG TPA: hypothetical protein [Caudoviricetes sp.]UVX54182.1 MAG: hypothetical protein [Bacteriophage sp.]UVX76507.1 MAG: hypothetical protein [Bacteriophage sp.]UVY41318.1 MAG: hypothetical protein [Bacteriophage sp.]